MRALVQEDAAAFTGPGRAPGSGIVIFLGSVPVRHNPVHPLDFSEFTGGEDIVDSPVHAVGSLVEHECEGFPGFAGHFTHMPCSPGGYGSRFFTQHMFSVFHGGYSQFFMSVMRYADQHSVAVVGPDQLLSGVINPHRIRHVSAEPAAPVFAQVGAGRYSDFRAFTGSNIPAVFTAHISDTDNPQSDEILIHILHFRM